MRIIRDFKSEEQYKEVLDKLKEYEGFTFDVEYIKDIRLFVYSHDISWSSTKGYEDSSDYNDWEKLSASDYLNPIKIGDRVEVVDDTEYNGVRGEVTDYCSGTDTYKVICNDNTENRYVLWRHQDCLQVLKEEKEVYKPGDTIRVKSLEQLKKDCPNKYPNELRDKELASNIYRIKNYYNSSKNIFTIGHAYVLDEWMIDKKVEVQGVLTTGNKYSYKGFEVIAIKSMSNGYTLVASHDIGEAPGTKDSKLIEKHYPSLSKSYKVKWVKTKECKSILQGLTPDVAILDDPIPELISSPTADSSWAKDILNTNNKTMNNTIETEVIAAADEAYFADKKNIKAISKTDTKLKELSVTLDTAFKDIRNKMYATNKLRDALNESYSEKNSEETKYNLEAITKSLEYLDTYMKTKIESFNDTKEVKEFNVEEFFTS